MHDLQLINVDYNTCITANEKPIDNIGSNNIGWVTIIHFVQRYFYPRKS